MSIERVPGAGAATFSKAVVVRGPGRTVYVSGALIEIDAVAFIPD